MKQFKETPFLHKTFETESDYAEWFGYYNYDPLNSNKTKVLCNRASHETAGITPEDRIELGFYDLETREWHHIDYSDSWNWQQGSMLQWIPSNNDEWVIFNTSRESHLCSTMVNINTGQKKNINWPIYGITPDGKKSISIDFERSYWCRAYHYQSVANKEKEGRIIKGDGIFEIDLERNTRRLLIDINDVVNLEAEEGYERKKHWLEHIMISPRGTRFCFLHRYSSEDDVYNYKTRLLVANIDGSNLQVIKDWNLFKWSHFGWKSEDDFTIYACQQSAIKEAIEGNESLPSLKHRMIRLGINIARPIARLLLSSSIRKRATQTPSYYQYYKLNSSGLFELVENWDYPFFNVDGHPSFTKDGRYLLTDSYPDVDNYRRYIVFDTITKKGKIIAQLPENCLKGNVPCDLHPKLSRDNNVVVFDSTYSGTHRLVMFELNWSLIIQSLS